MSKTILEQEVLKAIQSELDYQDSHWNEDTTPTKGEHSVSEWILYMEDYLAEARKQVARGADPKASEEALHTIRKVTTMGARCMHVHGAPQRPGFEV